MNTQQINQYIANKIIEKINEGVNPWIKGWKHPNQIKNNNLYKNYAYNYITGKMYTGINQIILEPGFYITFKQIININAHLKKGSISKTIFFTKYVEIKATEEKLKEILKNLKNENDTIYIDKELTIWKKSNNTWITQKSILKDYKVFNINDVENLKPIKNRNILIEETEKSDNTKQFEDNEKAEEIIKDYILRSKLKFENRLQDSAYYQPSKHKIILPLKSQFENMNTYYGTLFHELGHSTGHSSLLNRSGIVKYSPFGSKSYSKEELIAEMTSTFITTFLNINTDDLFTNSASYLKGWASVLNTTLKNSIMSALTKAQQAFNLILNISNDSGLVSA